MAMRDIRIVGDPVLRTACEEIRDIDAGVRTLVEDLLETVDDEGRAGLAANQIGVGLRAFSWNIDDEIGYILNPVIVELSDGSAVRLSKFEYLTPDKKSMTDLGGVTPDIASYQIEDSDLDVQLEAAKDALH